MSNLLMTILLLTTLLFSCSDGTNKRMAIQAETDNSQQTIYSNTSKADSSLVSTGFYFLDENGQGIELKKDHSDEVYTLSRTPFVSVKNILRATAQKNVIDGRTTYGVTIVLDNAGTKDLEQATGNSAHPYMAIVIANRLLYVVKNTSKIKTGIVQIALVDYSEKEMNDMIGAINQKR
jgi:preprotein translocase subunit SecD